MSDQVQNFAGVAHFVVVPGYNFNELVGQLDTSFGVEYGGLTLTQEVGRYNFVFGVAQNALHGAFGSSFHRFADFCVGGSFLQVNGQVNNRHVRSRNTESHTGQQAFQFRDNYANSLGSTGRGRDDVLSRAAATAPVFGRRTINGLLGSSGSVNGGHQTGFDTEGVVQYFGDRSQAVGGAGSVGNDVLASIGSVVNAHYEHRGRVFGRASQNNFLGTGSDVLASSLVGQEQTGSFGNNVNTDFVPTQVGRVTLSGNTYGFAVYNQVAVFNFNGTLETTVGRVVLQHVSHVVNIDQVVDTNNFDVRTLASQTEYETTDTAKTVNTYFDSHI